MNRADLARSLGKPGALLMLLALLSGLFIAAVMTGRVDADVHSVVAAHLNAFLGSLWIFAMAWSLPMLALSDTQLKVMTVGVVISNYSNLLVTVFKSLLKVSGVDWTSEGRNNLVFGLLSLLVVVPSVTAGMFWVIGFFKKQPVSP